MQRADPSMTELVLGQSPPPRSRLAVRFGVFGLIIVIVVGILASRLFYLQISRGGYYAGLAEENRLDLDPLRSVRGVIYDRAGRPLVSNEPSYVVKIRPNDLPFGQRDAVVARLSALLHLPEQQIIESLDENADRLFDPVRIASDVPIDVAQIISEEQRALPGVEVIVEQRRLYEYGSLVAHLMGYTGPITKEELENQRIEALEAGTGVDGSIGTEPTDGSVGYLFDDTIGKSGVELTFEEQLRGRYGLEQVERDATGRALRTLQVVEEPRAGNSLELTVDVEVQRQAETALRWATDVVDLKRGVVIVMNPQTGEVLAMVSLPTFDNNLFARGISNTDFQALLKDPNRPLINFGLAEQYPPGSTYKLVTGAGALDDNIINDQTIIETAPFLQIGTYRFWDWNRRGFGPLDIYDGFAHSSDTFFYQLAGRLGIDRLAHWAREFGFGERTGIDLPGEARGIVPTDQWKRDLFNQPIYPGEVYQAGIGQGYDTATPLQVLNAYCALANGGRLLTPQIVRRVLGPDGSVVQDFAPELIRQLDISPGTLRTMRVAAQRVVTSGHTYNLRRLPLVVAGKTGTAEFGIRDSKGRLPFHSWFTAFVPKFDAEHPGDPAKTDSELAIIAFAYDSNTKGNAATEIVKYFLQLHYGLDVDLRRPDLLARGNFYGGN